MLLRSLPSEPTRLRAAQFRGARAILGLSLVELAAAAGVSVSALLRAERDEGEGVPARSSTTASEAIRLALEAAGIRFPEPSAGTFGVSLDESRMRRSAERT